MEYAEGLAAKIQCPHRSRHPSDGRLVRYHRGTSRNGPQRKGTGGEIANRIQPWRWRETGKLPFVLQLLFATATSLISPKFLFFLDRTLALGIVRGAVWALQLQTAFQFWNIGL